MGTFLEDATMFVEDELTDQEEFEHLLYNQVYHSSETTEAVEIIPTLTKDNDNMNNYSTDRYFQNESTRRNPYSFVRRGFPNLNNYPNQLFNLQTSGFPLTHMLVSPINNIVVLPNPATQVFVNKEPNRRKRWKKKKKKPCEADNLSVAIVSKRDENKEAQKTTVKNVETIDVYDSNDSDVCYIEVKPPLVLVSSDDEEKTKVKSSVCDEKIEPTLDSKSPEPDDDDCDDDDVVFVPTKPLETITIEEEETTKLIEDTLPVYQTPEHIPALQKEVLGTPESTMSNDFLEGATELSQSKFNFGLHGVDFTTKDLNKPPNKPAVERSETESSASDISSPVKTAVFNEVPFESPTKNIFNENNLQNFADFIVPKRTQNASTPKGHVNRPGNVCRKRSASPGSDSSSESDYEEVSVKRKAQRLPSLSVFEEKPEDSTLKQTENVTITSEVPSTSGVDVKKNSSDADESKVNVVGMTSTTKGEPSSRPAASDDDGKIYAVFSTDSDTSTSAGIDMDSYVTVDEVFEETSNMSNKEMDKGETIVIVTSESEESTFDMTDLEKVGDDLQIVNCEKLPVKRHASWDETVQKATYSFDKVWTEDKERFYKKSWGQEDFSVTQVQKTMSDNPNLWRILDVDKEYLPMLTPKRRIRCRKCKGNHFTHQCLKSDQRKCILCGLRGHLEPRCPNKVCTMCGSPSGFSTTYCSKCNRDRSHKCKLCKMPGHFETRCPDLWRRYFLTTKEGPLVRPEGSEVKDNSQLSCSGCGQIGHMEHMCTYFNRSHPAVNPLICRYEDVYAGKDNIAVHQQEQEQDDLRKHLQNRERKAVSDESGQVNIRNYPDVRVALKRNRPNDVNVQEQITVTAVNDYPHLNSHNPYHTERQQFGCIFDKNKDLVTKNSHTSVRSLLDTRICTDANIEQQEAGCIFDRNKDIADRSNTVREERFSFLSASQNYFSQAKKSKLMLNPFVTSNFGQQKRHSGKNGNARRTSSTATTVFNGFEPDVDKPTPVETVPLTNSFPNSVKGMQIFLSNAFKRIDACKSLNLREVWSGLQKEQEKFDRKPSDMTLQTIKSLFGRLHIILFGIHKLQAGANAMKTLTTWRNYLCNKQDSAIVLPKHGLNDINSAYDYVFGNSRRDLDYQKLINTVDPNTDWTNYVHREIHKDYKFYVQNANGTAFKKLHVLYAKIKSGKGNIIENAQNFKKTFQAFYSNKVKLPHN